MNTQPHKGSHSSSAIVPGKFKRERTVNENSPYYLILSRQQYKSKTEINFLTPLTSLRKTKILVHIFYLSFYIILYSIKIPINTIKNFVIKFFGK